MNTAVFKYYCLRGYYDALRAFKSKSLVLTFEEYLGRNGVERIYTDPAMHNPMGHLSNKRKRALDKMYREAIHTNAKRVAELRREYDKLVREGKIVEPSRVQQLLRKAQGHDDNESVQAARRVLAKRYGIDWKNPPKNIEF